MVPEYPCLSTVEIPTAHTRVPGSPCLSTVEIIVHRVRPGLLSGPIVLSTFLPWRPSHHVLRFGLCTLMTDS